MNHPLTLHRWTLVVVVACACGQTFPEDVTPSDAGPPDASDDGGGQKEDGGDAADTGADAPLSPGCVGIDASFCDDFDRDGGAPLPAWQANGEAQARSSVTGLSLPWAFGVSVPASSDTSWLAIDLPGGGSPTHATFSLAVNIHPPAALADGASDEIGFADFGPTLINNQPNLRLVAKGTHVKLVQFDPTQDAGLQQYWTVSEFTFAANVWLRLIVDIDWASSPAALVVIMNGATVVNQPLHFTNFPPPTTPALIIGAFYSQGLGAPWSFAYDDVAFVAR